MTDDRGACWRWTQFTDAAFAALLRYFWIFLIMSQHKFGYIILMYSGVLVSVWLVNTNRVISSTSFALLAFFLLWLNRDTSNDSKMKFHQLTRYQNAFQTELPMSLCACVESTTFIYYDLNKHALLHVKYIFFTHQICVFMWFNITLFQTITFSSECFWICH